MVKKFCIEKTNQIEKNSNIRQLSNGEIVEDHKVKFQDGESFNLEINLSKFKSKCGLDSTLTEDIDVDKLVIEHPHLDRTYRQF